AGDGKVLSSLSPAEVGTTVPDLQSKLKQPPAQSVLNPFRFTLKDGQGRPMIAVAQGWKLPAGDVGIFGLVTQPEADVLQPLETLGEGGAGSRRKARQAGG